MTRMKTQKEITYSISELAEELDISTRAIRFYEEKGLITPERTKGNHRIYDRRDRARLKLILRGKRLGYSLDEIAEMIGMGNFDTDEEQQLKKAYSYGRRKLKEIESRMEELEILKQDLLRVQEKILNRLKQLNLKPPR
ncbi:DNA-binding transcriptional MerR regulator [Desulfosalsimonas propionicica]|jgi:DNA-binding transcriptional MerR regulator|uniref:DNA-binding transcriptional MerR regulator n=1 Tax=Desulfosalsimonas propionicica TaxID=332175 RepID=A0A7W0C9H9_9BACT|nr:MerR family DNA-binding transcriptional regulator [Desulfosalsimonas propionicica]MBA2881651.1 DNA-binding transcriptional MerR regulator [Desulfosalsimonas propionicica]MCF8028273.1 MerR family DNA-binding transcriptional regulator [Desulfobacteraceae bacterium]